MVYYYIYKGEKVGWKAQHLHDAASEELIGMLQELSKGREDNGVRVGVMETAPADVTRWVEPNFGRIIGSAAPDTLEDMLGLINGTDTEKT